MRAAYLFSANASAFACLNIAPSTGILNGASAWSLMSAEPATFAGQGQRESKTPLPEEGPAGRYCSPKADCLTLAASGDYNQKWRFARLAFRSGALIRLSVRTLHLTKTGVSLSSCAAG